MDKIKQVFAPFPSIERHPNRLSRMFLEKLSTDRGFTVYRGCSNRLSRMFSPSIADGLNRLSRMRSARKAAPLLKLRALNTRARLLTFLTNLLTLLRAKAAASRGYAPAGSFASLRPRAKARSLPAPPGLRPRPSGSPFQMLAQAPPRSTQAPADSSRRQSRQDPLNHAQRDHALTAQAGANAPVMQTEPLSDPF